jgi:predicted O-methyltransferase YrrM
MDADDHFTGSGVQHEFRIDVDPGTTTEAIEEEWLGPVVAARAAPPTRHEGGATSDKARLRALLPPGTPMPASGGWAASADLLLYLVGIIRDHRPARIVEIGSGTSTCWLAWAMDAFDIPGRVVSLEHLSAARRRTLSHLHACGVHHRAEVRLASLTEVPVGGATYRWYDPASWSDLRDCDLLLVDGPPGRTAPMARYPAVPLLGPAMRPGSRVVLDDYTRRGEQKAVAAWRRLHPDWQLQVLAHKKGTAVLTVPGSCH